ncbi:non-ribosomal peptide synthetase [Burkholderia metallica]|uniref:non-ribosomal peptide synthetase n=1 Tax=Burkholderia metallica TaxID=488729 RepID=UPI0020C69185|nr:non-ribosomal peptide synthetase [Burkholderia metallica]
MDVLKSSSSEAAGLHTLFEQQAAATPERIALEFDGVRLTYRELDACASAVARGLTGVATERGALIGLYVERSCELIVGMLGILKAGATYVPLDPRYPDARLRYLVDDARLAGVVVKAGDTRPVPGGAQRVVADLAASSGPARAGVEVTPRDSAYVIYTSGSTGQPKGVVVEHGNVTRLFRTSARHFRFGADDVWTLFHSVSFDFSVWEIWGALLHGGTLVIVPAAVAEAPGRFAGLVESAGVTMLSLTPTAFSHFTRAAIAAGRRFPALRHIVMGGERLEASHLRRWFEHYGDDAPRLVNMYGITETTVHVTYRALSCADLVHEQATPIGAPLDDLDVHLLDAAGRATPPGETGEIVVTGAGVARGYLRRPALDAERFVMLPLGPGGALVRAYRSGDLGCRIDGELRYVGRGDDQIKLRGFRIELREVEYQLGLIDGIESCVVVVQDLGDDDRRLLAFYVPDSRNHSAAALMAEAARRLPPQMVPARLIGVPAIPLTSNGKRNGQALMKTLETLSQAESARQGRPTGSIAAVVAGICGEALDDAGLSWDVDLFDQGATSLSISRIILQLNARFGLPLTGVEFDGDCSITNIAAVVNRESKRHPQQLENT